MAVSKSTPTPNTSDLARVATSVAEGAPGLAFPVPIAPIAPDPFVPDRSAPVKLTTVSDEVTDCASVAVTETFVSFAAAKARQISAVPSCTFVRLTSCHVNPPPAIPVTVTGVPVA